MGERQKMRRKRNGRGNGTIKWWNGKMTKAGRGEDKDRTEMGLDGRRTEDGTKRDLLENRCKMGRDRAKTGLKKGLDWKKQKKGRIHGTDGTENDRRRD